MKPSEDELLRLSAPLAFALARRYCASSCRWHHGIWQYLRLLGLVSSAARHQEFFQTELGALARGGALPQGGGYRRVLISGAADYAMLEVVAGAYGGGASQDSNIAAFRFYSYRDPRLQETLDDFRSAINWMLETPVSEDALEQSILGVVGSIDRPGSPAGEAKQDYHNRIFGRNLEDRRRFRQRVLAVSGDDLKRVTKQYLEGVEPSIAVLSNASRAEQLEEWLRDGGFSIQKL